MGYPPPSHIVILIVDIVLDEVLCDEQLLDDAIVDAGDRLLVALQELVLGLGHSGGLEH